ncbi:hypothetical protein [Rheinheimera soli]|uniref:Methyl-accepting chemotaxis protein n=1 Tax=Rheinheimera soli TaxID=443616 RepID=A0ABU1VVJ7_9GAMM|nr:hypothetical protein [Rheinheimera soli]MDR7119750.1 hypothetical protein [Rheinheimera soli]
MKISLTGSLLGIAALALAGLGFTVVALDSELTAQKAVVDKQVIQLANKQLEVNGLTADVQFLNDQAAELIVQAELLAGLNTEHEQQTQFLLAQKQDWLTNSNQLQVSPHEYTRTWANSDLPPDALQLLHTASRSPHGYRDKDRHTVTPSKFSKLGLRAAAL